jgi:succinoglycan biosynthesis protein ExoA
LNEEGYIEKPLRNLLEASRTVPMQIVVADGGSIDKTEDIVQKYAQQNGNVVFMRHGRRRQGPAINRAVETYGDGAEYLVRLDAHADYPADFCQTLLDEAKRTKAASVVVAMHTEGKSLFQRAAAAAQNSILGNGGSAHRSVGQEGKWIDHGHHALMSIDAFRIVGGYDETFTHNEDAELDTRLHKAGYKIWLTGKTSVTYYPRATPESLFQQYMNYGYGRAQNIFKHRSRPKLRQLAPAAILPVILLALFSPWSDWMALPLVLWAVACLGYGLWLGAKANDMHIALAGPIAMLMHLGWSIGFWKAALLEFWRRL